MTEEKSLMGTFEDSDLEPDKVNDDQEIDLTEKPVTVDRPEGLPIEFWDNESGSYKGDKLYEAWKSEQEKALGLRQKLSKGMPKAPQTVDEYTLEGADGIEVDNDDKGFHAFKNIALSAGLTNEQFQKVMTGFNESVKNGDFGDDIDQKELSEEEEEKRIQSEMQLLGKEAAQVVGNLKSWGKQMFNEGVFSREDLDAYMEMGFSARHLRVLEKMRQVAGYINDVPVSAASQVGGRSKEEIESMMRDPRYWTDPAYRKPIDEWFANNA